MSQKRGRGEGTVKQLKSGQWVCTIMVGRKDDGRVRYDKIYGQTRAELSRNIAAYHQNKSKQPAGNIPFCTHAEQWYSRHQRNLRTSSKSSYPYTLKKLINYWGITPISSIKPSQVSDMLADFEAEGLSLSYLKKLRGMLHQIFDAAVADDLINKNPVAYTNFKIGDDNKEKAFFSAEEIDSILAQPVTKIRNGVLILLGTGIRLGEFLALRGVDCESSGRFISIVQAANMDGGTPFIGPTKNKASIRTIPVPTPLQHIIADYSSCGEKLIWASPYKVGLPINPSTFRDSFRRFCKKASVHVLTPHCCRHTYASLLNREKANALCVKRLMGHTTTDITAHYTHSTWEDLSEVAHLLDKYFE